MRHEWIYDVLSDLLAYASRNDLPALARKIEDAIQEMRRELADGDGPAVPHPPPQRRVN